MGRKNLSIEQIILYRKQLIYAKNRDHIERNRIKQILQSLAISSKPVSTEFFLSKKPSNIVEKSKFYPFMTNSAPLKKAIIGDNVQVKKIVDYIISDYDLKSIGGVKKLYLKKDYRNKPYSKNLFFRLNRIKERQKNCSNKMGNNGSR